MALTQIQRDVCGLLAEHRRAGGESYVAGGLALNELLAGQRRSRDIDLFHDTEAAVQASFEADRGVLEAAGFGLRRVRALPAFVEAVVSRGGEQVVLQWAQDSAYRFFPLVEHPLLGLALHPFDLATNKLLALVGRREARDWIDAIHCHASVQPLGYLAWAAAGKDPGFGPLAIVEEAARASRYTQLELDALDFEAGPPDAAELSRRWHAMVAEARDIIGCLPGRHAGTCVITSTGDLVRAPAAALAELLAQDRVQFHAGRIRGAWPEVRARGS